MAKNLKKTMAASTVDRQQEDSIWTLVRQVEKPVDSRKGWEETANPVRVPERLRIFAKGSRFLTQKSRRQPHNFVLIIALKGAGQACLNERIFRLEEGQALLIFPFQFRYFISLQESSIRWIAIGFEMEHADSLEFRRNQPWQLTSESMQILRRLLEALSSKDSSRIRRATEAQLWLALLLNQGSAQEMRLPSSSLTISAEAQKMLERIHGYFYRHMSQPFKLEDMACGINYSKSSLRRQFKEHFKISLGRYVAQVRLNKAVRLLHENTLNISGVAQACGYSSISIFSRKFSAAMGCSPRNYRVQINKVK